MKKHIRHLIQTAAQKAFEKGALSSSDVPDIEIEEPKSEHHGDFATNVAMLSAKTQRAMPRQIAQILVDHLDDPQNLVARTEIAGPGFINFFIQPSAWPPIIGQILDQGAGYGASKIGQGQKVQVEFVSANPTGPLHVGHGRGAAVGDAVANILACSGFDVQREYYINDSGRQIQTLGRSIFERCLELLGQQVKFSQDGYQGEYIQDLARQVIDDKGADFITADSERAIQFCARFAANAILDSIRQDLEAFGVTFDQWFSEQSLFDNNQVHQILETLKTQGVVYTKDDDAWWFKTSDFGDEKDRVVIRQNGQTTYFASDIAYHCNKYQRGFDRVIDVWGADHHGYIPRMTAAVEATGRQRDQFKVILIQFANLLRGGEPVAMSTRAGEFVTLKEVVDEVGRDAARFIFLTRDANSPLDFDLDLAKEKSNDNPVYYVQYVHARIASILRKAKDQGFTQVKWQNRCGQYLQAPEDIQLIKALRRYPEAVRFAALNLAPHRITYYLMQLSALFHGYYNKHRVLTEDSDLTCSRLCLISAVQKVIGNGLLLLGVSAPNKM